jgi:hypothetical protein
VGCHSGVATDQAQQVVAVELRLGRMGGPDRADDLADIGTACQGCAPPRGPTLKTIPGCSVIRSASSTSRSDPTAPTI